MTTHDVIFFIAGLVVAFAFALSVQMRILSGIALKRAAKAKFSGLDEAAARQSVVLAVNGGPTLDAAGETGEAGRYLAAEYPRAISHIRFARKGTAVFAVLLLGVIAAWRFTGGGG
ncbi:MAG: hypothetical protein WA989_08850 [Henriciella sp.]|uniref:hypothetical protein n=1 Tax=Henriciella sp. TaxID=1968823 RepID=UPI003C75A94B